MYRIPVKIHPPILAAMAAILLFLPAGCSKTGKDIPSTGTATKAEVSNVPLYAQTIQNPEANSDVVEIRERLFIAQVNDVYLNPDDYWEKTIKYEGIFRKEQYGELTPYCYVLRYGPGCCGDDGNVGFEVRWANEHTLPYPDNYSWVEARGKLKTYSDGFYNYLYLELFSLTELSTKGNQYVSQ